MDYNQYTHSDNRKFCTHGESLLGRFDLGGRKSWVFTLPLSKATPLLPTLVLDQSTKMTFWLNPINPCLLFFFVISFEDCRAIPIPILFTQGPILHSIILWTEAFLSFQSIWHSDYYVQLSEVYAPYVWDVSIKFSRFMPCPVIGFLFAKYCLNHWDCETSWPNVKHT